MTANSKIQTLETWLANAKKQKLSKLDAELLCSFILKKPRTWLHAHLEYELTKTQQTKLNKLLERRLKHEPIAYIVGEKEFYGRIFSVNPAVLVPRPESEDFIEIIKRLPKEQTFIDIGTGSGILAVTTVLEQPTWSGTATDISLGALKVAQKNAKKLRAKNLVFKQQNLLVNDHENYDVVLANLPYVPKKLRGKADIAREPEIALFADDSGLALYKALFQQIKVRQQKPRHILTESLLDQHNQLERLAEAASYRLAETRGLIQHFERT